MTGQAGKSAKSPGGVNVDATSVVVTTVRRRLLLVGLAERERQHWAITLRSAGYSVRSVADCDAAVAELSEHPQDLVVAELPSAADEAVRQVIALRHYDATVIGLLTDQVSALAARTLATQVLQAGAYDLLVLKKALRVDELLLALAKAAARQQYSQDSAAERFLPAGGADSVQIPGLFARSPVMLTLIQQVAKVAASSASVLIMGESGTGKELIARALHQLSPRRQGPFVAVNCGALPSALLESLLFGHVRGAYTDAVSDQAGVFVQATGGTLFLDEVGEIPTELQVKLLRALQERQVQPLGQNQSVPFDARVITATLRDLEVEVQRGRFRSDLYYRLNVVPLRVPPLRQRPEDVVPLAQLFLQRILQRPPHQPVAGTSLPVDARAQRAVIQGLTPAAKAALERYSWPGNVRELQNAIERAAVLCETTLIDCTDLPNEILFYRGGLQSAVAKVRAFGAVVVDDDEDRSRSDKPEQALPAPLPADAELRLLPNELSIKKVTGRIEEALIRRALLKTRGNRSAAAKLLELSHRALLYKLRDYGLAEKSVVDQDSGPDSGPDSA